MVTVCWTKCHTSNFFFPVDIFLKQRKAQILCPLQSGLHLCMKEKKREKVMNLKILAWVKNNMLKVAKVIANNRGILL